MLELSKTKGLKYNLMLLHLKQLISMGFKPKLVSKQKFSCWIINGIENLQLASLQGGISINATPDNLLERSEVVIIFTLIMVNQLLTKQDLI
jgi:hypothetical protein